MVAALAGAGLGGDLLGSVGGLVGNIAVLAGAAGKGGEKTLKKIIDAWQSLKTADYDFRAIPPAHLQVFAEYFPEVWQAVVPEDVKTVADTPELREAQMRGVAMLEEQARGGRTLEDRLGEQEAGRFARTQANRDEEAILGNLRARGLSGGDEIRARLAGAQGRMETNRGLATDLERMRQGRAQSALAALPGAAGAVREQDIGLRARNADIINRFNESVANMQNRALEYAAGARERAQFGNVGNRQRLGETNELLRSQQEERNQEYLNNLRTRKFMDEVTKLQGLTGAETKLAEMEDLRRQDRARALRSLGQGAGAGAGGGLGAAGQAQGTGWF